MSTHLLLTSNFPPLDDGIASWTAALARGYERDALIVSAGMEPGHDASDAEFDVRIDRLPVPRARLRTGAALLRWLARARQLALAHDVSFVWCANIKPAGYVACALRRSLGIPYGVLLHGTDLLQLRHRIARHPLKRMTARAILGSAQVLVANSDWTRALACDVLETLGAGKCDDDVRRVHLGADPERFRPDIAAEEVRARFGLTHGRWMLTVGRLAPNKGQDTGVRVLAALRDAHPSLRYAIAGAGPREAELRALAASLGVAERVRFLGRVAASDLPALYNAAEIYIGPSREVAQHAEGFGISFVEASASGRPVVATRAGGAPEAVLEGETGLLADPDDVPGLAAAVRRLLEDRALASRLGARGRAHVERYFNWSRVTAELRAIPAALANGAVAPRTSAG